MTAPLDAAIVVSDLRKHYGKVEAVRGISFAVRRGTTTALLGGNGAGKTTTLSMLLGVLTPTAGAISVLGCDMLRYRYRVLPRMNFTSPYVDLPKRLTVVENLRVFADLYGLRSPAARIAELAAEFDLAGVAEATLRQPVGGAAHARVAGEGAAQPARSAAARRADRVARSRHRRPDAHATSSATSATSRCTMLLASHNMGEVERMCDDVIMLRAGLVVDQGSPEAWSRAMAAPTWSRCSSTSRAAAPSGRADGEGDHGAPVREVAA